MISAKIIADSISRRHQRITTFILVFPRIILAEFNTHRMFSRNSASSRAIPFKKMLQMVEENPFIPIKWMKDHKGMQGNEYWTTETCLEAFGHIDRCFGYDEYRNRPAVSYLKDNWLHARNDAMQQAKILSELGLTKQFCNRLLEPFMWHTVIVTGTEWENFFALRAHPAAEIHMQELAEKMLEAYNESRPNLLKDGEWHIPFGDNIDSKRIRGLGEIGDTDESLRIKIATARCARISYLNFEGKDDYKADIKRHDQLAEDGHWSPFEHCAKVMTTDEFEHYFSGKLIDIEGQVEGETYDTFDTPYENLGWSGNFRGFIQYRKMFDFENKKDDRVIKTISLDPGSIKP